jgi:Cu-Zn family superoxide dismutase
MRKTLIGFALLAVILAGGWILRINKVETEALVAGEAAPVHEKARAELRDRDGNSVAVATLTGTEFGVRIEIQASGLSEGRHGYHIHETGRCEAPDFTSAGGHFNPGSTKHGMENPAGPHGGDLPNLVIEEDGTGSLNTLNPYISLGTGAANDLLRAGATSLMIHAGPDDYYTDPAGDSGARIACGVIERVS